MRSEKGTDTASVTKTAVKGTPLNPSPNSYFKAGTLYCWSAANKNKKINEVKLNQIQAATKWQLKVTAWGGNCVTHPIQGCLMQLWQIFTTASHPV